MPIIPLISRDNDLKPLINVRTGQTDFDTQLDVIVGAVTSQIQSLCRQKFAYNTVTEFFNTKESARRMVDLWGGSLTGVRYEEQDQMLLLGYMPVDTTQPVQIWYDVRRNFDPVNSLVDPCHYIVDPDPMNARVLLKMFTLPGNWTLKVSYNAGFAVGEDNTLSDSLAADAPDLKQAAILSCVHFWKRMNPNVVGSNQSSDGNKSRWDTVNAFGLPKEATAFLGPYKRLLTGRR